MSDEPDPVALTLLLHLARRKLELAEIDLRSAANFETVDQDALRIRADQCQSTVSLIRAEIGDG